VLPPISLNPGVVERIKEQTRSLARELKVIGLMNIQYAVKDDLIYVLEVNPRASRTVPFVSKATGVSFAKLATKVIMGMTLKDLGLTKEVFPLHVSVKESVFPFARFPGVDTLLSPEMKSTGEVMGIDENFGLAFAKAQLAAGQKLPLSGTVLISVKDEDKAAIVDTVSLFSLMGFRVVATRGTSAFLKRYGIKNQEVRKVGEGRPNIVDMVKNREINLVINTTRGKRAVSESSSIRRTALNFDIPYTTTVAGAKATALAIKCLIEGQIGVKTIQEYHGKDQKS